MILCCTSSKDALGLNFMELEYKRNNLTFGDSKGLALSICQTGKETTSPENFMDSSGKCIKNIKEQFQEA